MFLSQKRECLTGTLRMQQLPRGGEGTLWDKVTSRSSVPICAQRLPPPRLAGASDPRGPVYLWPQHKWPAFQHPKSVPVTAGDGICRTHLWPTLDTGVRTGSISGPQLLAGARRQLCWGGGRRWQVPSRVHNLLFGLPPPR